MATWRDRIRESITLTAPDGTQFVAKWAGNDITSTKRVGEFNFPLVDDTITQDLGVASDKYTLTLMFDGDDHDINSWTFKVALRQRGPWQVVHPVYGSLSLQPLGTSTLSANPTESANLTVVETTWIESPQIGQLPSAQEIASKIIGQVDVINDLSASQFASDIDVEDIGAAQTSARAGASILSAFQNSDVGISLASTSTAVGELTIAINKVTADLQATVMVPLQLASDVQSLIQLAGTTTNDLPSMIVNFAAFIDSVLSNSIPSLDKVSTSSGHITGETVAIKNTVAIVELFETAALTAMCLMIANSVPATREDCLSIAETLSTSHMAVLSALDDVQNAFAALYAVSRYTSESETYASLALLMGFTAQYLLSILFDLKIARTLTLDRPKPPLRVVIEEYGNEYDSDGNSNLDLFLFTNNIVGREVVLLPAGKTVTIYEAVA